MQSNSTLKKQELSIGKQKALQDLQDYYEYARNSSAYQKWINQALINFNHYRGNQSLDSDTLKEMRNIGATPHISNRIEKIIDLQVSLLLRSGKRVGYESSDDNPEYIRMAENLKHLAYDIQTKNDHAFVSSQISTSSLITGMGWSHFFYQDNDFVDEYINPLEMLWDPDDHSAKLNNSSFACRVRYIPALKLKTEYHELAKEFEKMVEENSTNPGNYTNYSNIGGGHAGFNNSALQVDSNPNQDNGWVRGRSIKVVEVYYKKSTKYYQTTILFPEQSSEDSVPSEQTFKTFDKSIAEEKSSSGKIETKQGTQIWRGMFCDELLIWNEPIAAQIPNQKYLPFVPVVHKRDYLGIPYGVIDNLIPLQRTRNYLWSTTMHYLDAKMLIASDEQVDTEKLRDHLKHEMRDKNGVVFVKNPNELQVLDNEKKLNHRMTMLESNDREFETQTGLFDELKGEQTNAVSGVAISQRAANSMNAQNTLILSQDHMIVSKGRLMLDTFQGLKNFQYSFKFFANGQASQVSMDDSISLVNFEVYTDISPNFSSSIQEEQSRFAELMNSPNPTLLMSSPLFLKERGFRENSAYKLSEEYMRIMGLMQPQDQVKEKQKEEVI